MPRTGDWPGRKRSAAGSVRRVTTAYSRPDQAAAAPPLLLPAAWLAALDVDGQLSFRDISPILADDADRLLSVLWRRTNGTADRMEIDTDAGQLWVYLSVPGPPRRSPLRQLRRPPSNPHGRHLLRRLGVEMTYCVGAVLFTGRQAGRDVGLSLAQQQLLRQLTDPAPTATGHAYATAGVATLNAATVNAATVKPATVGRAAAGLLGAGA